MTKNNEEAVLVIPVHGTFDTERKWTFSDSEFCGELAKPGGIYEIVVDDSFAWSGDNSHQSRISAGQCLADHVGSIDQGRFAAVVVVAHSHGGNVALYGLRSLVPQTELLVVTLGTPFLAAECENSEFVAGVSGCALVCIAGCLTIATAALVYWPMSLLSSWTASVSMLLHIVVNWLGAFLLLGLGAGAVMAGAFEFFAHPVVWMTDAFSSMQRRAEEYAVSVTSRDIGIPIYCIRVPRDEAYLWLGVPALLARLALRPLSWPYLLAAVGVSITITVAMLFARVLPAAISGNLTLITYSALSTLTITFMLVLGGALGAKLARGHKAGFDSAESIASNWLVKVRALEQPVGFPVSEHSLDTEAPVSGPGLRHSRIHESKQIAAKCRSWIESTVPHLAGTPKA